MVQGPMEFGKDNDAGTDTTILRSTHSGYQGTMQLKNTASYALRVESTRSAMLVETFPKNNPVGHLALTAEGPYGVQGEAHSPNAFSYGVGGYNYGGGNGVFGRSYDRNGVQGVSHSQQASGVYGENLTGSGWGVAGRSNAPSSAYGAGVLGVNTTGADAGLFMGVVKISGKTIIDNDVQVNGDLQVNGAVNKSAVMFKIDHPLDPPNQYLLHAGVESPDMMNVYNGNVSTDADGNAIVELPGYFEALNRDFRYQLTVIGEFAQAIVAEEVKDNRFKIKTDKPNVRVSWQIAGIRQDAWAKAHPMDVEVEKLEGERGKYLAPAEHEQPATAGIYHMEFPVFEETETDRDQRERRRGASVPYPDDEESDQS